MDEQKTALTGIWSAWFVVLAAIPSLSYFGRPLQYWAAEVIGYTLIAVFIALIILLMIIAYLTWLHKNHGDIPYFQLLWLAPVFLVLPFYFERIEERLHFLTFGSLGALSAFLFRPKLAILVCLLVSMGDELFQFYLADRVGDWRDVLLNALASISAACFIFLSARSYRKTIY